MRCRSNPQEKSSRANRTSEAIEIQDILQSHDTFQLVHIGPADHRQHLQVSCPHAFQRQTQRVIGVQVRKVARVYKFTQSPIRAASVTKLRYFSDRLLAD